MMGSARLRSRGDTRFRRGHSSQTPRTSRMPRCHLGGNSAAKKKSGPQGPLFQSSDGQAPPVPLRAMNTMVIRVLVNGMLSVPLINCGLSAVIVSVPMSLELLATPPEII